MFTGIVNYKLNHLSAAHAELVRETQQQLNAFKAAQAEVALK